MNVSKSEPFYRYRNINSCISEGISAFTDNIRQILLLTSPVLLVIAFIVSVIVMKSEIFFVSNLFHYIFPFAILLQTLSTFYMSVLYSFFEIKYLRNITLNFKHFYLLAGRKYLKLLSCNIIKLFLLIFAFSTFHLLHTLDTGGSLILWLLKYVISILLIILILFLYSSTELIAPTLIFSKKSILFGLKQGFKYGITSWNKSLKLFSIILFLKIIFTIFVLSPVMANSCIYKVYHNSIMNGDNATLTDGFHTYTFITFFVTIFFFFYLHSALSFPHFYLYATFVAKENDKKNNRII